MDRTAGGIGGAAPASLDLYGQSSLGQYSDYMYNVVTHAGHSMATTTFVPE